MASLASRSGSKLIERFGDMLQGDDARVIDLCRERRFQDVAGIEPRQLLTLAIVVVGADNRQRLQRPAEAALGFLGRARHSLDLAFGAGEQRHQQIGFAQRIGAENDRFRLLQWHGWLGCEQYDSSDRGCGVQNDGEQNCGYELFELSRPLCSR